MIGFIYHRTPHLQVMTVGSCHSIRSIHKSRHLTFVETKHTLQHVGYLFFRGLPIARLRAAAIATPCARPNLSMD